MTLRIRPMLAGLTPYQPGLPVKHVKRRFGLEEVVKLASNEFPLPPFPQVRDALIEALDQLQRYPDGSATDLREALGAHYDVDPSQVTVGNGSCELLLLLGDVMLEAGDEVVLADPSFSAYLDVCHMHGARVVPVPLADHRHDLAAMATAVTSRTKMVFICNPNNPTGTYVPVDEIRRFVEAVPADVLIIIDEAYNEFVISDDAQDTLELQREHANVIVLRTFSKVYGLCGLRVGYGLCAPELKDAVDRVRQPFNVGLLAQVAAVEALKHQDQVMERRELNAELRAYMVERLAERDRATVPSQANFVLVGIDDLRHPQDQVCGALLQEGVIVRDGNGLGCPGWARVSVGTQDEIDFFLRRLATFEVGAGDDGEGRPS